MEESEKLLVSSAELDRRLLWDVLAPYIRIDKRMGEIRFMPEVQRLSQKCKVLIYLLGRKAAKALGVIEAVFCS